MRGERTLRTKKWIRLGMIAAALLCLSVRPSEVRAADEPENQAAEIVFLLDTSVSMNQQDKERAAIEAIRQMSYSLPSDYQVGLVAYHTGIQTTIPLTSDMKSLDKALENIEYTGYTNAGEGLDEAVKLFSNDTDTQKHIIMISDGEIDMPESDKKELSRTMYVDAANRAKDQNIRISIVAIGSEMDARMNIFDGAQITGGAIYWEGQSGTVPQIMERIISDQFSFPRKELGITDAGGGCIYAELPTDAERVKVMITSSTELREVSADYTASQGNTTVGRNFAVVDMKRPSSETALIHFQTEDMTGIKATLLTEYTARPQIGITYRIEEVPGTEQERKKHVPPVYEHYADITIQLVDSAGDGKNLWEKDNWEGKEISYLLNKTQFMGVIEQGQIQVCVPADKIETIEVSLTIVDTKDVWYIEQPVTKEIEKYPDPEPEPVPDYRPLWAVLILLAAAIVVIVFLWVKKKNTTVIYMAASPKEAEKKLETKNCSYTGRFSMYVVRTKEGKDIPPQTYPLFGRPSGRLTLDKILSSCGIKFGKIGAEDIIFYPGPDHSIILMDQSEGCTVMRGSEIMKKGMGYPVFYHEKITITFEDGQTEMEIHYKNLKPGEREKLRGLN